MSLPITLACFAIAAYAAGAAGLTHKVLSDGTAHRSAAWLFVGFFGALFHLSLHVWATVHQGSPDLHFFAALSLIALGMTALTLAAAWLERLEALAVLVFPVAGACVAAYAFGSNPGFHGTRLPWPIQMHAWLALLAYAGLALATLFAAGLWLQERALRQRRITGLIRALPPLTQTEKLLFRTLSASFSLLTLALVIGLVFVEDLFTQDLLHKTVLSLLSWAALGTLLFGHWRWGWRGPRAARWTLVSMALLGLAFFGSKFVLELVLQRT